MLTLGQKLLCAIYDEDNPDGIDHDFYRAMADELAAQHITDLGCGTGILTVTLAKQGRTVIGIDPDPAMLAEAKSRYGGELVTWIQDDACAIPPESTDLVIMSGNVAMHILGEDWNETLAKVASGLRSGGKMVFESRNPDAKAWEQWNNESTVRETSVGKLRESRQTSLPDSSGIVAMNYQNFFVDYNCEVNGLLRLQFRTHDQILADLKAVGLTVENSYRNWERVQFTGGADQPLMVFVAHKSNSTA